MAVPVLNGKTQFLDAAGVALALGSVSLYVPGTTTPKQTWQDQAKTILNTTPTINLDAGGYAIIYGSGAYRQIVKDVLGNTIWDQVAWANDPADIIEPILAAGNGASLIGYTAPGSSTLTNVAAWLDNFVTLTDFGVTSNLAIDETAKLQNAVDQAMSSGTPLLIERPVCGTIDINGASGLVVLQLAPIYCPTGTHDAVVTIRNSSDVTWGGRLWLTGLYNTALQCGVAIYTDNATPTNRITIHDWKINACQRAFRIGRTTETSALVSEINIFGGNSYGCPTVVEAYGTNTVCSFNGCSLISDAGDGDASWQAITGYVVRAFGSSVTINGGEVLRTAATTGVALCIEPISDASVGHNYGSIKMSGGFLEAACRGAGAQNSLTVTSPVAGSGLIALDDVDGYHSGDSFAWFDFASDFTGKIFATDGCNFRAGVARTHSNIIANGNADIYVGDSAFGKNFIVGLNGIAGGVVHFSRREILRARNMNGLSLPNGTAVVLKPQDLINTQDTARFAGNYSSSTGKFTVGAGGLRSVIVWIQLLTDKPTEGLVINVFVNGGVVGALPFMVGGTGNSGVVSGYVDIGDLAANDYIEVKATNQGTGATTTSENINVIAVTALC